MYQSWRRVHAGVRSSGPGFVVPATVGPPAPNLYTGVTNGSIHSPFDGCVGSRFFINTTGLAVTHLSRWKISGNSLVHTVYLCQQTPSFSVLGSVSIDLSTGTAGSWVTVALGSPISLTNGDYYAVMSAETSAGDQFYSSDSTAGGVYSGIIQGEAVYDTNTPPTGVNLDAVAPGLFVPVNAVITP